MKSISQIKYTIYVRRAARYNYKQIKIQQIQFISNNKGAILKISLQKTSVKKSEMGGSKPSRKQRHRKASMHPNNNSNSHTEKDKNGQQQATRDPSTTNVTSKGTSGYGLQSSVPFQGNAETKANSNHSKKKNTSNKQDNNGKSGELGESGSPSKKSKSHKEHGSKGHELKLAINQQDSLNMVNFENQSFSKQQEALKQQNHITPQKGKMGLTTHKQKTSMQKMSPTQQKSQKFDQFKSTASGLHHSSLAQHQLGDPALINPTMNGYRVSGHNFTMGHSSQTPIVIKTKIDGLVSTSMGHSDNMVHMIPIGQPQMGQNNLFKTPFIQQTIKSQGIGDTYIGLNGHLISDMEGNLVQHTLKKNGHGVFNSNGKMKQGQALSSIHDSVQITPRRIVSGMPFIDNENLSAAYHDFQKSTSIKQGSKRQNVNATGPVPNNQYFKKTSIGQSFNQQQQQMLLNQNMMVQGKNSNQIQLEINNYQKIAVNDSSFTKNGKQLAQSQDSRPLTGQNVSQTEGQYKTRLDMGVNNKSTHILLPHKDQMNEMQQFNLKNGNKGTIAMGSKAQNGYKNNQAVVNNSLIMSAPRTKGLEIQNEAVDFIAMDQEKYVKNLESQERAKIQLEMMQYGNKASQAAENYKSLQVNRSNTTTGYIAGVKTQVQLSQNLQHSNNQHLATNGMNIMSNGIPPNLAPLKQSMTEEKQNETGRLVRDHSESNMTGSRFPMNNKNSHVRKLVSNFKVHGKRAPNESMEGKNQKASKVFKHKRNSQNQQMQGQVDMLSNGSPERNMDFKDYPVSDPSRNIYLNGSTSKVQENFSQSTKDPDIMSRQVNDPVFQIQPTIVFSAKTTVHPSNLNMNTVDDEIFQNNGRQIAEGYNSFKMAQLLNKEQSGSKSKSSIGVPTVQSHQLNMQLFEMQFLKGQDNSFLGVHKMQQSNMLNGQAIGQKEQLARQQQQAKSPGKQGVVIHPKASQPQFNLQKNSTFGGYSYNASKPNNLIYSVHHHIQNAQDQLNGTSMTHNPAASAVNSFGNPGQQQQNSILYHKPTNSSSILALQNQASSTVRQDQLILSNAIRAQNQNNPLIMGQQAGGDKKLMKVKDVSNMANNSMMTVPEKLHEESTIVQKSIKQPSTSQAGQTSANLILQHKTLAKGGGSQQATQSNTQIGRQVAPKVNSQQRQNRMEESSNIFQASMGHGGGFKNQQETQITKGISTLQQAIQNLWTEQERIVAEIFTQNKHIDPNSLNMIIQSQLNSVKIQPNHMVLGQKFVQPYRNAQPMQGSQMVRQASNQIDIMNNYKTQLEGLQALKNLQEFLEISAHQNVSQLIQNRSKFLMQGGYGTVGIPQNLVKQLQPKKPPTDLYGNPINIEKQKSKIPFENAYVEDCYKYIVMPGNNSQLIRKALERRSWWIEIQPVHSLFNFRWQPLSHGIRFDRLSARQPKHGENYGMGAQVTTFNATMGGGPPLQNENVDSHKAPTLSELNFRQAVNHLEFHQLITEKFNLLHSMQKFCDLNKENVFDFLPVTFYIEMPNFQKESAYNAAMQPFVQYFQVLEDHKEIIHELKQELVKLQEKEEERERQMAEQREIDNQEQSEEQADKQNANNDPGAGSESDTGADGDRAGDDGELAGDSQDAAKNHDDDEDQDASKKKEKGLLSNQPGFSTVYKTPGKENPNNKSTKFKSFNFEKRNHMRLTCPLSHFDGHNLWLLKPTHLNRGRGIHVFNDLKTLHQLIKEYCVGKDEESWKKKSKIMVEKQNDEENNEKIEGADQDGSVSPLEGPVESPLRKSTTKLVKEPDSGGANTTEKKTKSSCYKIKHNTFVIQKYIERPLLICDRKFDFRVWVLLDQDHNLYFFKEGYIRTSASIFSIDSDHIDNAAVHLTNNAVQKALDSYGQFEDGNQLSFDRFQEILLKEQPDCGVDVRRDIVPAMKHQILKSFYSVRKTIDPYKRKYCFELFGYDFIIDEDFNTWLIEVNTNPCLEESSQMLRQYLPRMIEDMLKITIDQIFPRVTKKKRIPIGGHNSNNKDVHGSPIKLKNRKLSTVGQSNQNVKHFKANSKATKQQLIQGDAKKKEGGGATSPKRDSETEKTGKTDDSVGTGQATEEKALGTQEVALAVDLIREDEKENQAEESEEEDEEKKARDMAAKYARRIHPVPGYSDTENMWEKMLNLEKTPVCPPQPVRFCNNKNRFNIAVQEKIFKIKKNPCYTPYNKPEKPAQTQPGKNGEPTAADEVSGDQLQKSPSPEMKKKQTSGSQNESIVAAAQQLVQNSKRSKAEDAEDKSKQLGS